MTLVAAMLVLSSIVSSVSSNPEEQFAHLPLRVGGVVVGYTRDSDILRLYGPGVFKKNEGHGGGRYYSDVESSVTLHTVIGVDGVIEEVSFKVGTDSIPESQRARAKSAFLKKQETLEFGLRLGVNPNEVIKTFGPPTKTSGSGTHKQIVYETDYHSVPWVLFYRETFEFKNEKLVSITLYNGE